MYVGINKEIYFVEGNHCQQVVTFFFFLVFDLQLGNGITKLEDPQPT